MPSERVERLRRGFEAFTRAQSASATEADWKDLQELYEFIDAGLEVNDRILPEANPSERGPEALIANAAQVKEAFGDLIWEPVEIIEHGDYLLARVHVTGKGLSTSLPMDDDIGQVYTLKDEKAIRLDIYRTWEEAREAAGLDGNEK